MRRRLAVVLGWLMLLGGVAAAEHRGVLSGRLIDGSGTPLAGAVVKVEDEATGGSRSATTNADGRFTVPELDPGSYRITVADDRFRAFTARAEIRGSETTIVTLPVAQSASTAAADFRPNFQSVDRVSPGFRTRFDAALITAVPLDGRNINDLVVLTPGVTASGSGPLAAGSAPASTAALTDGVAALDPLFGTVILAPLPESIVELAVLTPALDARLGRSAGAQINLATRSGTNRLAGTAFGFYQRDAERLQAGGLVGGPAVRNSTFFFADLGHTRVDELDESTGGFTQAAVRLDQLTGSGRLTARYGVGRGGPLDRSADLIGVTHVQQLSDRLTNDARFGFARLDFGERWSSVLPEFDAIEAASVLSWSASAHLVSIGAEWYGLRPVAALRIPDENTVSAFAQDRWQATSSLSLTGGIRFDRLSREGGDEEEIPAGEDSLLSPRAGFAWAVGAEGTHVVRGDYGRHLQADGSALDAWSMGLQRQWGRTRTVEVGYIGTRVDDEWTGFGADARYNGLRLQLQQRSDTALSVQAGYTYGRWTIASTDEAERVRASLDARHKLSAAFIWRLPFGKDARWFTAGLLETIFGDMEVTGIAASQSGRPRIDRNAPQRPSWRTVDLALVKTIRLGRSALELRAEMFNASDRSNPRPPLLGTGIEELFASGDQQRRLQFGGRFRF